MTTPPGWEPRPGPTRGEPARRPPREGAPGWSSGGQDGRTGGDRPRGGTPAGGSGRDRGQARDDIDPRQQRPDRYGPGGRERDGRYPPDRPAPADRGPSRPTDPRDGRDSGYGGARRATPPPADRQPGGKGLGGLMGRLDALDGLRTGPALRWLGTMSTRVAIYTLLAATLIGVVGTVLTGNEPGFILGFFVSIGAIVATLGVRRGAVHLFFPLPALILFLAGLLTGAIHDTSLEGSTAGLGVGFLQWIAGIFYPILFATILTVLIGGLRWLLDRQLVTGQFPMSGGTTAAPRSPRPGGPGSAPAARPPSPRRAPSDPWSDDGYSTAPRPARDQRPPRDQRDPWGDPQNPRQSPTGNRPATPRRPADRTPPPDRDPRAPHRQPPPRNPRDPRER